MSGPIVMLSLLAVLASAQGIAPPIPSGLWQQTEKGFVVRIDSCGTGFCGFAAGIPRDERNDGHSMPCGARLMEDFRWNPKSSRWEGRMLVPGRGRGIGSSVVSDGKSFLRLRAQMLLMSKTMTFVPFTGRVGEGCRLE